MEEAFLKAFPALEEVEAGDWLLRFAPGISRRANSANPRRSPLRDLEAAIPACEDRYRQRGMAVLFRVPSFIEPALDRYLEARGYTSEGDSPTLYGHRDAVVAEPDTEVELLPAPTPEWLAAMAELQRYSPTQSETYRRIVAAVAVPAVFAGLRVDGGYAALAFGIVHDEIHCCESVVTAPAYRRRGGAQRTMAALHAWALDRGAKHFCLQVDATNTPALNLYRGLGLAGELYRYHYRREPARG